MTRQNRPRVPQYRVACTSYKSTPTRRQADAERRLVGIEQMGECGNPHTVEVSTDGGRTWMALP